MLHQEKAYIRKAGISDKDMALHSKSYEPDYIVLMEESLAKNPQVMSGLKEKGGILINSPKQPEYFYAYLHPLANYEYQTAYRLIFAHFFHHQP
jgi:Pyruvate/2-oxoacid:ferredoxin oxidoreductase gamma subunit